ALASAVTSGSGSSWPSSSFLLPLRCNGPERHPESAQERAALLVRPRRRHDRDLETAQAVDLVVFDLGEHELLLEAEREVSSAVPIFRMTFSTRGTCMMFG